MKEYLTESKLKDYLKIIYPNYKFIHDKKVPNSNIRNRPDYRNDELKLIIEFDGYLHYTSPKVILNDIKKYDIYTKMGYKVINIPYFVQISKAVIKHLFNKDVDINQEYPHGFIDKKAALPSQFCTLGINRFKMNLEEQFNFIKDDIISSLDEKVIELKDKRLVYPLFKEYDFINYLKE